MRNLLAALPVFLTLAILSLSAATPHAGSGCFSVSITGEYVGGEFHVTMSDGYYPDHCWTDVTSFLVFRSQLGSQCGPDILVTPQPLLFDSSLHAEIVDAGVDPNKAYRYWAMPLGLPGNPNVEIGYVTTGVALIAHGTLYQAPDCGISGVTSVIWCESTCFLPALVWSYPAEAVPYINTDTELLVYGEVAGLFGGFCNTQITTVTIASVEESSCIVAVRPSTWGAVKAVYR